MNYFFKIKSKAQKFVLALFCSLFVMSCGRENTSTGLAIVNVDPKTHEPVKLSDIAENVTAIALETLDDNLISVITKIAVGEDFIFLIDRKYLYQFTKEGKFVKKIGSLGQGPGEISFIKNMTVDWAAQKVYLATGHKLICFSFSGDLIQEKNFIMTDVIYLHENGFRILKASQGDKKSANGKYLNEVYLINLNKSFQIIDSLMIRSIEVERLMGVGMRGGTTFLSQLKSEQYMYYPVLYPDPLVRDTLYQLTNSELHPYLRLDFGIQKKEDSSFRIMGITKSKDYLFAPYFYKRKSYQFLYHQRSGKSYNVREGFDDDIYNTGKVVLRALNLQEDTFYFAKEGMELEGIIDGVTADDNPYLFIVSLK